MRTLAQSHDIEIAVTTRSLLKEHEDVGFNIEESQSLLQRSYRRTWLAICVLSGIFCTLSAMTFWQ